MESPKLQLNVGQSIRTRSGNFYRIAQPIGGGKNASAYLTLQTSGINAGNFCALKVVQDAYNDTNLRRFETEIETLTRLTHPSIMQIVDSGEYNNNDQVYPFYLSDYYQETLSGALRRGLSLPMKLAFALQMVSGLAYLEKQDIVHCDVKPDNVFVRGFDCAIGDFGLVHLPSAGGDDKLGPSLHNYRSPDIAVFNSGGAAPTSKSDVFQLGLVFTEMFTGVNICQSASSGTDPVKLDSMPDIHGAIGRGITNVLDEMLKMNPLERLSASELIDRWQGLLFTVVEHRWKQEDRIF